MKSFGSFIRYERKSKGLTQEQVAENLNIVTPVLSKWENDKGVPALTHLCKLCCILDISIEDCICCERTECATLPPEEYNSGYLGNTVRDLRVKNGWSQEEVGKNLFVTSQTVSKWENGGISSLDVLQKLSELYEVSPTLLLNGLQESTSDRHKSQHAQTKRKRKIVLVAIIAFLLAAAIALGSWGITVAVKKSRNQEPTSSAGSPTTNEPGEKPSGPSTETPKNPSTEEPVNPPATEPDDINFCLPLENARCYRKHGERFISSGSDSPDSHNGVDFFAEAGDSVYAVADGVIEKIFSHRIYEYYYIIIERGDFLDLHMGCKPIEGLAVGDEVKKGDLIGCVSEVPLLSEESDGPHLHFAMKLNGEHINPLEYISYSEDVN